MNLDDTIVAIATPPGRGGIGIVRLAGPDSRSIAASMLRSKPDQSFALHDFQPAHARFAELVDSNTDGSATRIDEVVVTYFAKPRSYTTDDIVEISAHGSPVVLRHIVEIALARGARLAEPGEFTMRAFLNGRIDLTQAEAVRDLIDSQTVYQAKVAAQQLDGALSHRLRPIKQDLIQLIALMEAGIDFAEDDVPVAPSEQLLQHVTSIRAPLAALQQSFAYGKLVHEGLTLAIVGRPNVGKSSIFNRLIEREHAIVTATPGTTRDLVTETVAINGIPVRLIDTAGIRKAIDEAETIGIRKSMEALADADIVLLVMDTTQATADDRQLLDLVAERRAIVVENKADLLIDPLRPATQSTNALTHVRTSATTGRGLPELRQELLRQIGADNTGQHESGFLTNARHQQLVTDSLLALERAKTGIQQHVPHEMVLLDLYAALHALDEITGATTADDILNQIFGSFCIGK